MGTDPEVVIDFNGIRAWKKTVCFLQKEVIRYICHSIKCVPSYSIFSFTTNLLAFKTIFGRVSENCSPRNVLLNIFVAVQQLSSLHSHGPL